MTTVNILQKAFDNIVPNDLCHVTFRREILTLNNNNKDCESFMLLILKIH